MAAAATAADGTAATAPWPKDRVFIRPNGSVAVEWSGAELTDEVLEQFVETRLPALLAGLPSGAGQSEKPVECTVNLSENRLCRPEPVAHLLRDLRTASVHVTVLRLHKNRFGDDATQALAAHILASAPAGMPLMQLHLSGNDLGEAGIRCLIEAAHRCGGYPRPATSPPLQSLGASLLQRTTRALWLRTEQQKNTLQDPMAFLKSCEDDGFPVCVLDAREEKVPADAVVHMHYSFVAHGAGASDVGSKGKAAGKGKAGAREADGPQRKGSDGKSAGGKGSAARGTHGDEKGHEAKARGKGGSFTGARGNSTDSATALQKAPAAVRSAAVENDVVAWLKERREQPGPEGQIFEAAWKDWCAAHNIKGLTKAERMKTIGDFKRALHEGEVVLGQEQDAVTGAGAPAQTSAAPATQEGSGEAVEINRTVSAAAGGPWIFRAAHAAAQLLERARAGGFLRKSLVPDKDPGSEWDWLSRFGAEALYNGCRQRASDIGSGLLEHDECLEVSDICVGGTQLPVAFRMLRLGAAFGVDVDWDDNLCAKALSAIFGELRNADADGDAALASRALLNFVFLVSMGILFGVSPAAVAQEAADAPQFREPPAMSAQMEPPTATAHAADERAGEQRWVAPAPLGAAPVLAPPSGSQNACSSSSQPPLADASIAATMEGSAGYVDDERPDLDAIAAAFGLSFGEPSPPADTEDPAWAEGPPLLGEAEGPPLPDGAEDAAASAAGLDEEAQRQRRVELQRQRRGEARWNYTGVTPAKSAQPHASSASSAARAPPESNEQAMLRMLGPRLGGKAASGKGKSDDSAAGPASNFKRHICKYWEEGRCHKGDACTFAHGADELSGGARGRRDASAPHRGPSWEAGPA